MIISMIQKKFKLLLLVIIIFSATFSFLSYRSSVVQLEIIADSSKETRVLTFKDVDDMLNG